MFQLCMPRFLPRAERESARATPVLARNRRAQRFPYWRALPAPPPFAPEDEESFGPFVPGIRMSPNRNTEIRPAIIFEA